MPNQIDLLSDAAFTHGDWIAARPANTSRSLLPSPAETHAMLTNIVLVTSPAKQVNPAWSAARWVGLFLLEILLVPVSGRRPPKWSVIRPLAERLVFWWDRRITKR